MSDEAAPVTTGQGLSYGALGLPLAFVALPLYVILPNHYATSFGMPLATLGLILLGARLFDAVIDPVIGRWCDRLFAHSPGRVLAMGAVAAVVLAAGFGLLFFPATRDPIGLMAWAAAFLVLTYAAYSALSVAHQSWGAMLGGDETRRSRIVAWREGLALLGVVLASVAPTLLGLPLTWVLFCACLAIGWLAWTRAMRPRARPSMQAADLWLPLRRPGFRRLLAVFVLNGIASAIPATLVLFFVQDRLLAPRSMEPAFLGTYFVCAAASMPLWLTLVGRIGLARTWMCGMVLNTDGPGDESLAYDYLDAMLDPTVGKVLIDEWGYGHSNGESYKLAESEIARDLGLLGDINKFLEGSRFQGEIEPDKREKMIALFDQIKLGG